MLSHLGEARAEYLKRRAGWQGSQGLGGPVSAWSLCFMRPRTANREKDRVDGGGPWANPSALPHFLPLSL